MSIRRRLFVSFLVIVGLFGVNLMVYFWGNQKRKVTLDELRRAMDRASLMSSIDKHLNDRQKQMALMSQIAADVSSAGADDAQIQELNRDLADIGRQIEALRKLSDAPARTAVEEFAKAYQDLSESWRIFFINFGRNQPLAITELALRAEPRSQKLLLELLPNLVKEEEKRVKEAGEESDRVNRLTDQITLWLFLISIAMAVGVSYRVSHYLTTQLTNLKLGAELIGGGEFNHRITIHSLDELGQLAIAYNEMADNLYQAQKQMTLAKLELESRNEMLDKQRQLSESLLLNILPEAIAAELQSKGSVDPKYYEDVTILFTDFVGFTLSTEKLAAEELVHMLHDYFTAFDQIADGYGLEKLKTIGDSYMCVAGLQAGNHTHPLDTVLAAFEMLRAVEERERSDTRVSWQVRIGIHTGPIVAGVVGINKFAFDIWGDSVNYASRMESSGLAGCINLSWRAYSRVKDFIECEHRGKVLTKDKLQQDMYLAKGILPNLVDDPTQAPPPAFLRRYRLYFQKDPRAFPAFLLQRAAERSEVGVSASFPLPPEKLR